MINPIRFGGMASGLDTENMLKQIMQAERMPVDRMFQQKQQVEWKQDAYRDFNKQLLEFRNAVSDLRLQGSFQAYKSSSTNESVATARGSGSAANFSYDLKVNQLAESAYANSAEGTGFTGKDKIADTLLNGEEASFKINGTEFKVTNETTMDDLVKQINGSKTAGVSAFFDEKTQKLSISAKSTGEGKLNIEDTNNFLNDTLKVRTDAAAEAGGSYFKGQDASFVLNGLETTRDSNNFNISGVEFSLKGLGSTKVSSVADTDAVFDKIKGFVDKYNALITATQEKLTEKTYRDYKPLTKEQRAELTDKEAELWDEKAMSGMLRGDQVLTGILSDMRQILGSDVKGLGDKTMSALFEMGITTGDYSERGILHIDEDKLRKAIEEKPNEVMDVFTKASDVNGERGIASRLYENVSGALDKLVEKAGRPGATSDVNSVMSKEIKRFDEQIERFEMRLADVEARYWKQFTAMEKALASMQSQSDSLMSMLMPNG